VVIDFLAATDIGNFPPILVEEPGHYKRGKEELGEEEHGQPVPGQDVMF